MLKTRAFVLVISAAMCALLLTPVNAAVISRARDVTHEVVCSCSCGNDTQSYEYNLGDDCSDYDGITCTDSNGTERELEGCVAKSQPAATVVPHVLGDQPIVPGIDQPLFDLDIR